MQMRVGSNLRSYGVDHVTLVGSNIKGSGNFCNLTGSNIKWSGDNNNITGSNANLKGHNNNVTGSNARVRGNNNKVRGTNPDVEGENNQVEAASGAVINNFTGGGIFTFNNGAMTIVGQDCMEAPRKKRKDEQFVVGPPESDLEHDKVVPDDSEKPSCVICLTNEPSCIAMPCRDKKFCVACARKLCFGETNDLKKIGEVTCPACRKEIQSIERVFE